MKKIFLNKLKNIPYSFVIDNEEYEIFFDANRDQVQDAMILFKTDMGFFEHKLNVRELEKTERYIFKYCDWTVVDDYMDGL